MLLCVAAKDVRGLLLGALDLGLAADAFEWVTTLKPSSSVGEVSAWDALVESCFSGPRRQLLKPAPVGRFLWLA